MNTEESSIIRICRKKAEIEDVKIPRYSEVEYRQQMMASIRLYKYLDLSVKKNMRPPVFLFRNLLYVEYEKKSVDKFVLGINEPPLAFKRYVPRKLPKSLSQRRSHVETIAHMLRMRNSRDSAEIFSVDKGADELKNISIKKRHELAVNPKRKKSTEGSSKNSLNKKRFKTPASSSSPDKIEDYSENIRSDRDAETLDRRGATVKNGNRVRETTTSFRKTIPHREVQYESQKRNEITCSESEEENGTNENSKTRRKTPRMKQINLTHQEKSGKRFSHPLDMKTRRGKQHYRLSVYSYLGKFPKENGVYINAEKFVKNHFTRKFLNRKDLCSKLEKMFPVFCPHKLNYRFCGVDANIENKKENYRRDREKNTGKYLMSSDENKWVTICQTKSANKCIICQRSFVNFYTLLFHYNANYPRLKFALFIPKSIDDIDHPTQIDVSLNPYYNDAFESTSLVTREKPCLHQSFFLVTQHHRFLMKTEVYMDLSIFTESLATTDLTPVFKTPRLTICTRTGLPGSRTHCEEHPNFIPDRSFEFLTNYLNRSILDFTDVDDESKEYMCYWNDMSYTMGRAFQTKLGLYFRLRIFINKYGETIKNNNLRTAFHCHMKHLVDKKFIEYALAYDILMRLFDKNYYPLNDPSSRISRKLVEYTEKMRIRYRKSLTHPQKRIIRMKRKVLLRFNKHYQKKPSHLSVQARIELFKFILSSTKFGKTILEKKWRYLLPLLPLREIVYKFPEDLSRVCQLPIVSWTRILGSE